MVGSEMGGGGGRGEGWWYSQKHLLGEFGPLPKKNIYTVGAADTTIAHAREYPPAVGHGLYSDKM